MKKVLGILSLFICMTLFCVAPEQLSIAGICLQFLGILFFGYTSYHLLSNEDHR